MNFDPDAATTPTNTLPAMSLTPHTYSSAAEVIKSASSGVMPAPTSQPAQRQQSTGMLAAGSILPLPSQSSNVGANMQPLMSMPSGSSMGQGYSVPMFTEQNPVYQSAPVMTAQVVFPVPVQHPGDQTRKNSMDSNPSPQVNPTDIKAFSIPTGRLTTTLWDDEGTLCYQVECRNICVARRQDNNMVNGTKLLNVVGMTRGKRDGILKNERNRLVVKVGSMHLKGVWIPFERAKILADQHGISRDLYPLFENDPTPFLFNMSNGMLPIAQAPQAQYYQHGTMMIPQQYMIPQAHTFPMMQTSRPMYMVPAGMTLQPQHQQQTAVAFAPMNGGYRQVYAYPAPTQMVYAAPPNMADGSFPMMHKSYSAYPILSTVPEKTESIANVHPSSSWAAPPHVDTYQRRPVTIASLPPPLTMEPLNPNGKRGYTSLNEDCCSNSSNGSPINTSSMQLASNTPPQSATLVKPLWAPPPGPFVTPSNSHDVHRRLSNSSIPFPTSNLVSSHTMDSAISSGGFSTSSSLTSSYALTDKQVLDQPSTKKHRSSLTNPVDLAVVIGGAPLNTREKSSVVAGTN